MRPVALALLVVGFSAGTAHAGNQLQVKAVPIPWLVQGEAAGAFGAPDSDVVTTVTDSLVYSNTNYAAGFIYGAGLGVMFADDIHLILPGRLTQFYFFYVEIEENPLRFTVAFHANDATDTGLGPVVGGPYQLGPFRWGAYRVHASLTQDTVRLDRDAWFAASIASPSAGLVLADPPYVGTSHDLYYDAGLGGTGRFSGAAANFYLQVFVVPESVPVGSATWSAVKALFRPAAFEPPRRRQ